MERIIGKTPTSIEVVQDRDYDDSIKMTFSDGTSCKWYHRQDCCEDVHIDDINGDFNDLIGSPIMVAECRTSEGDVGWDHETWTFYTFRGIGGSVDVKWHGSSTGDYSEEVDFEFYEASND
jgi:hypothetical protein